MVAYLRADMGRHPADPALASLIGDLSIRPEEFRRLWAAHEVRDKSHGLCRLHHPIAGDLDLNYETMRFPGVEDQMLVVYTPEPGSVDALRMLRDLSDAARDRAARPSGGPEAHEVSAETGAGQRAAGVSQPQ